MYFVKTPGWLRKFYSPLIWHIPTAGKEIYLSFDDGPHPVATPFVLDTLEKYNAKATFFCIGKNVKQYPEIYRRIKDEGHAVGNHTFSHVNGWKTGDIVYLTDVLRAQKYIYSNLFRPPYGRISKVQIEQLQPPFKIIMWDVLSADFDVKVSKEKCLQNVVKNTRPGSIIVFHDSEKAMPRLEYALPRALDFFAKKGFICKAID